MGAILDIAVSTAGIEVFFPTFFCQLVECLSIIREFPGLGPSNPSTFSFSGSNPFPEI